MMIYTMRISFLVLIACCIGGAVAVVPDTGQVPLFFSQPSRASSGPVLVAQTDEQQTMRDDKEIPKSGTLLLPESLDRDKNAKDKKCMTVCNRWGEDCIIDPRRGRQCRRTCKEFGEACF
jgi:hypothetical protein